LAEFAIEKLLRSDNNQERPLLSQVRMGLAARTAHYDYQKETLCFDEVDFHLMRRRNKEQQHSLEVQRTRIDRA
jgi:hypothetical protein